MNPSRAEIWGVNLGLGKGHEQAGQRPGLIVSVDKFNHGPAGLVVVIPLTTVDKQIPWHVKIEPPEGGVNQASYIKTEDVRSVSKKRLSGKWGTISKNTMGKVDYRVRILLNL